MSMFLSTTEFPSDPLPVLSFDIDIPRTLRPFMARIVLDGEYALRTLQPDAHNQSISIESAERFIDLQGRFMSARVMGQRARKQRCRKLMMRRHSTRPWPGQKLERPQTECMIKLASGSLMSPAIEFA